jgi:hypothetical protein
MWRAGLGNIEEPFSHYQTCNFIFTVVDRLMVKE